MLMGKAVGIKVGDPIMAEDTQDAVEVVDIIMEAEADKEAEATIIKKANNNQGGGNQQGSGNSDGYFKHQNGGYEQGHQQGPPTRLCLSYVA